MCLLDAIMTEYHGRCAKYHLANLLEVRTTAAEFIIALSKNVYYLQNLDTLKTVFSLIETIFNSVEIFSLRFLYHTLRAQREIYASWFSFRSILLCYYELKEEFDMVQHCPHHKELLNYGDNNQKKKNATHPTRSKQNNKLPKLPKLDNFKCRFGSKTQKYR